MQKALDILEKNVQWIALGIGAIYLLWIVYAYLLTPPVSTTLRVHGAEQTVTLGNIDEYIAEGPAHELQRAMENQDPIRIGVADFSQQFVNSMRWSGEDIQPFNPQLAWIDSPTAPIKLTQESNGSGQQQKGPTVALPAAPAAPQYAGISTGRSEIAAKGENQQPQSSASEAHHTDKIWASAGFKIPVDAIARDFTTAKIPDAQAQTLVLRVEMVRQEQLPDGSWSKESPVKPLAITNMPALPAADQRGAQPEYRQWATSNQPLILQPPFYQTVGGDVWYIPGTEPPPPPAPPKQNFDPSRVRPQDLDKLTPDQKKQYFEYRQEQQKKEAEQRRQRARSRRNQQAAPPDVGMPPMMPGYSPSKLDEMGPIAQARPALPPGAVPPMPGMPMVPGMPGMPGIPGMPEMPGMPGMPQTYNPASGANDPKWVAEQKKAAGKIPNGQFLPAKTDPILAWVHDENVEPGHTYRYRARYVILNPLFHATGLGASRADIETFSLESKYSDWTEAVKIPPVTVFFVDGGFYNNTARFQVFHWQEGQWHGKSFTVAPGDIIGQKDDGVDYSTGWTLVAISDAGASNPYALVTNGVGLERRGVRSDRSDPMFNKLKQEVAQAAPPPGAPTAPGGVTYR